MRKRTAYYFIIGLFVLSLLIIGCRSKEKSVTPGKARYSLKKIDSIEVGIQGNVQVVDYDTISKRIILYYPDSSLVAYGKSYNDMKTFRVKRDSLKNEHAMNQIGMFSDSVVVIANRHGYFMYNLDGVPVDSMLVPSLFDYSIFSQIGVIKNNNKVTDLVTIWRDSVTLSKFSSRNDKRFYLEYKALTFYNFRERKYAHKFGYDPQSIFRKFDHYYPVRHVLFDINNDIDKIFVLHNPEQKIYQYSTTNDGVYENVIDLEPSHFKLDEKMKFSGTNWGHFPKIIALNSQFNSLRSYKNYLLISYNSSIPKEEFEKIKSESEIATLYRKFNKNYVQIFRDNSKVGGDIELPEEIFSIALVKSLNYVIGETNEIAVNKKDRKNIFIYALKDAEF